MLCTYLDLKTKFHEIEVILSSVGILFAEDSTFCSEVTCFKRNRGVSHFHCKISSPGLNLLNLRCLSISIIIRRISFEWPMAMQARRAKVLTQVYMLDSKIRKLFRPCKNRRKRQNVINSSVQHLISLIFSIHVPFTNDVEFVDKLKCRNMLRQQIFYYCNFATFID